jgi:hypothetical protein
MAFISFSNKGISAKEMEKNLAIVAMKASGQ